MGADAVAVPAAPQLIPVRHHVRQTTSLSSSSFNETCASLGSTKAPLSSSSKHPPEPPPSAPAGQALEDAGKLCAFMEAAQNRSAKRPRVTTAVGGRDDARVLSDHGSTTSESRGSSESSDGDEAAAATGEDEAADAALLLASRGARGGSAMSSPALWTSRQVLERYVREVC